MSVCVWFVLITLTASNNSPKTFITGNEQQSSGSRGGAAGRENGFTARGLGLPQFSTLAIAAAGPPPSTPVAVRAVQNHRYLALILNH